MARIRTIKPDFFNSYDVVCVTPLARLFYAYLWTEADREGLLEWKPKNFLMRFFPTDGCYIEALSIELEQQGLIEIIGGEICRIPSFAKHQVINNREAESTLLGRVNDACTRVKAEGRKEGKGKEGKGTDASPSGGRFKKPSHDDLRDYFAERNANAPQAEAEKFYDFYESKGWKVGKDGMKDWKASVRNWLRNNSGAAKAQSGAQSAAASTVSRIPKGVNW